MKKNKTLLIGLVIGVCSIFILFSLFKQNVAASADQEAFEHAKNRVHISYKIYGDGPNDTLLMVANNNDMDIHVKGSVNKWDENGVQANNPDVLDFNVAANKTYIMPAVNPNNGEAREAHMPIKSAVENLEITPANDSDPTLGNATCLQDDLTVKLFPEIRNDQSQALISFNNQSIEDLAVKGYVIFYTDRSKSQIQSIVQMSFDSIPASSTYRTYLTMPEAMEVYEIYVNEAEIA